MGPGSPNRNKLDDASSNFFAVQEVLQPSAVSDSEASAWSLHPQKRQSLPQQGPTTGAAEKEVQLRAWERSVLPGLLDLRWKAVACKHSIMPPAPAHQSIRSGSP